MSTRLSGSLLALFVLVAGGMFAWAQSSSPRGMPYQGRLETAGVPANGSHDLVFSFHDAATGGSELGTSIARTVNVVGGAFATVLSPVPDEVFDGEEVWLGITVDGTELAGRQALLSVPFAMGSVAAEETTLSGGLRIGTGFDIGEVGPSEIAPSSTIRVPIGDEAKGGMVLTDAQEPGTQNSFIGYNSAAQRAEVLSNGVGLWVLNDGTASALNLRTTGTVRLDGFGDDGCPADMERVGMWCIDEQVNAELPISTNASQSDQTAIRVCHSEGKGLCPLEALVACDTINPSIGAPVGSCGEVTDRGSPSSYRVATITTGFRDASAPYSESVFLNFVCYDPTNAEDENSLDNCVNDQSEEFFCCTHASPVAVGGY